MGNGWWDGEEMGGGMGKRWVVGWGRDGWWDGEEMGGGMGNGWWDGEEMGGGMGKRWVEGWGVKCFSSPHRVEPQPYPGKLIVQTWPPQLLISKTSCTQNQHIHLKVISSVTKMRDTPTTGDSSRYGVSLLAKVVHGHMVTWIPVHELSHGHMDTCA